MSRSVGGGAGADAEIKGARRGRMERASVGVCMVVVGEGCGVLICESAMLGRREAGIWMQALWRVVGQMRGDATMRLCKVWGLVWRLGVI